MAKDEKDDMYLHYTVITTIVDEMFDGERCINQMPFLLHRFTIY